LYISAFLLIVHPFFLYLIDSSSNSHFQAGIKFTTPSLTIALISLFFVINTLFFILANPSYTAMYVYLVYVVMINFPMPKVSVSGKYIETGVEIMFLFCVFVAEENIVYSLQFEG